MKSAAKNRSITNRSTLFSYLEVMRPANIVTAFADILAGFAAAGGVVVISNTSLQITPSAISLGWLLLSTFGLYGGGVVFNDYFDADLDAKERPERPIPSGRISKTGVGILGSVLCALGIYAAFQVNNISGTLAVSIVVLVLLYDKWAKHHTYTGPAIMGSCRGLNLLLGASILPFSLWDIWFLAIIPIIYIAAITLVSQGEVHGGSKATGNSGAGLILLVFTSLILLAYNENYNLFAALPFLLLFGGMVIPPFIKAARQPTPQLIRSAIKRGVLSLIILNSALSAGFAGITMGILVLILLPLSMGLSSIFSVT